MINTENAFINEINEMNISLEKALEIVVMSTNPDEDTIQLLIDHGADINFIDNQGNNLLINALEECRLDTAKLLINKGIDVNFIPEDGISALMTACIMGTNLDQLKVNMSESTLARFKMYSQDDFTKLVQLLVEQGADINAKTNNGETALLVAVATNNIDAIKLLIDNGVDITARDNNGLSALYYAVVANNTEAINLLIEKGADVNQKIVFDKAGDKKEENTLLSFAVMKDLINKNTLPEKQQATLDTIQLLIDLGADINAGSPLFYAAFMVKSKEITQLLIDNGADMNQLVNGDALILDMLISHGHYQMLKLFIHNGADINLKNISGKTPLLHAIGLKENDPFEKIQKDDSRNALQKLLLLESYEDGNADRIIKLLVESGANLNTQCDITKNTALLQTVKYNDYESIKLLLKHGADVDIQDSHDLTALMYAENKKIRNLLLRYDAKGLLNYAELKEKIVQNDLRKSKNSSEDILSLPEQSSVSKDTMLMHLYESKKKTNPKMILAFEQKDAVFLKEATKELKTLKYVNVLNLIKENFPLDFIEVVLQKGGDVNITDSSGITPLIQAVVNKDDKLIRLLLRNGADIDIANNQNLDCIDLALASLDYDMAKLLLQYGQDHKHRPQQLSELLKKLSEGKLRLTNHDWDEAGLTYEKFIKNVNVGWNEIKDNLKILLSEKTYQNMEDFLFNDKLGELDFQGKIISWGNDITIGWSSKEMITAGNKPHLYKNFKEAMDYFKSLFVIKQDNKALNLLKKFTKIRKENNYKFNLDLEQIKEVSVGNIITDVYKLELALATILSEINDRVDDAKNNVKVTLEQDNQKNTVTLKIIHVDSISNSDADTLEKAIEKGGFKGIYENLSSVCDWSIETICPDGKRYKVDYLYPEIDTSKPHSYPIDEQIEGFTHILRFYI